jgi:hypothetical protein
MKYLLDSYNGTFLILTMHLTGRIANGPESLLDSYTGTFLILTMHLTGRIADGPESLLDFPSNYVQYREVS